MQSIRTTRARAVVALALVFGTTIAFAGQRPAIVELYTSEGCSSCPPAERLLEGLAKRPDVLPLAFHVDYWDSLGWRDRFSMKEATERQQSLANTLRLSTVGTPQLIVDGQTAVWGANPSSLEQALKTPRTDVAITVQRTSSSLIIRAPVTETSEPYDVYVVGYLPKAVTAIQRGENAGRTLTEVNVVRYIRKIGGSRDAARSWNVSLAALPSDAKRVVVLLQVPTSGAIIGALAIDPNAAGA
ncbi:MAG: DUF1223 domain-containing protein [Gammaproteobacteria bacterium]